MSYRIENGIPKFYSNAVDPNNLTQAERDEVTALDSADIADRAAAEETRVAKRPKRTVFIAVKAENDAADSIAKLRAVNDKLLRLIVRLSEFQQAVNEAE